MKRVALFVSVLLVLCGVISAQQQRLDSLRAKDFQTAFNGSAEQFENLMKIVDEALANDPKHALGWVLRGMGSLRRAGDAAKAGNTTGANTLFQSGFAEMDKGVRLAPDNVNVRIPRGSVLIGASRMMPPKMGRPLLDTGVDDYEMVLKKHEADGTFAKKDAHQRGELLTGLADGWTRKGDAAKGRAYFDRIIKELDGTIYEQRARAWLDGKPEAKVPGYFNCTGCHVE